MAADLGAVSANLLSPSAIVKGWGRTSGGASQSLDTPSYGIGSITDSGVGILDVTWETPFSAATAYAAFVGTQKDNSIAGYVICSTTITATAVRFFCETTAAGATDPTSGYHFTVVGGP